MTQTTASLSTQFTRDFGVTYPIIAAPMFLVSNVNMVVAAGEAGGFGTFPALNYRPIAKYREALEEIKNRTKASFGVNIIVQKKNKHQHNQLDASLEAGVPLLITSLGNPKEVIRRAHETSTKVYCDVVGLEHAKKVADLGADGVIAVGSGAGGHAGNTSLFALIPYLRRNISIPIVAAGSISDGAGMLAALALGADAAYLGTRFIASKEADVPSEYKQAIIDASSENIVNTDRVDGFPGNFILTDHLKKIGVKPGILEYLLTRNKKLHRGLILLRAGRMLMGSDAKVSYKTIFSAGHGVAMIDDIKSIQDIIQDMVAEYEERKQELA